MIERIANPLIAESLNSEPSFGVGQVRTTPAPGLGGLVSVAPQEYPVSVRTKSRRFRMTTTTIGLVEQTQDSPHRYSVLLTDGTLLTDQTLNQVGQLISQYGYRGR